MGAISSLKNGEQVKIRLFMKACDVRKTNGRPPKDYLNASFTDGEDELEGKIWNYLNVGPVPTAKKCYDLVGTIGEYNGKKQITLTSMLVSDNQDTTAFTLSVGIGINTLWAAAQEAISLIQHDELREIVATVYAKYTNKLATCSSAKGVHHVGAGGNILHSLEAFNIASAICDVYTRANYSINKSLCQAGALLHDIGKADVYEIEGPSVDYTYIGHIHDHIVAGIAMMYTIDWTPRQLELVDLLIHIISSHHGALEYGSPTLPKFMEAHVVAYADSISASFDTLKTANAKAPYTDYVTERVYTLGNLPHITQAHIAQLLLPVYKSEHENLSEEA